MGVGEAYGVAKVIAQRDRLAAENKRLKERMVVMTDLKRLEGIADELGALLDEPMTPENNDQLGKLVLEGCSGAVLLLLAQLGSIEESLTAIAGGMETS